MTRRAKAYEIRKSPIHGNGVFAARDIKNGERIMEYLGEKISKEESNRRGLEREEFAKKTGDGAVYIFELDDEWDIDGNFEYNDARLINHACRTNSESVSEDGRIYIYATRDHKKGRGNPLQLRATPSSTLWTIRAGADSPNASAT